jgi:hypothetical protein
MPSNWGSKGRQVVVWVVAWTFIVGALVSVLVSLRSLYWYPRIYAFWIIAPPGWFFVEYNFVFNRKDDPQALERFKVGQGMAEKFWASLLVLLAGIGYFQWHLSLK